MKTCIKCLKDKELSEFYTQNDRKSGASYCKSCFNEYCIKRWTQRKVDAVLYKGGKCIDCGLDNEHPSVYEFHHLDPKEKDYTWTKLRLRSIDSIKRELDKCAILCANCHRKRHWDYENTRFAVGR